MCQKAFGSVGGLFVDVKGLEWTRGQPSHFQSSNVARRGFCAACGTPLTYETDKAVDISIGAFDRPDEIAPVIQLDRESRLPWFDAMHTLPGPGPEEEAAKVQQYAAIVSRQHPDHDTENWEPGR